MSDLPLGGVTVEIKATVDVLERDLAKARAAVHGFDAEAATSAKRAEASANRVGKSAADAATKAAQAQVGTAKAVEKVTEASKTVATQAGRTADAQVSAARRAADAQIAEQRRVAAHAAAIARGDLVKQTNPLNGVVTYVPNVQRKVPVAASIPAPVAGNTGAAAQLAATASGATAVARTAPMAAAAAAGATASLIPLALAASGAAAALLLVSRALLESRNATKFASELTETGKRLGVTTDALQEYRYAAEQSGLATSAADQALAGFGKTLALAQQGSAAAVKTFKDLGFTDADIKRFKSVEEAMAAVLKRLDGLTGQARVDMVEKLGLDAIAPAIANGTTEMQRLRDEAKKAGVVMDAELVERGAEIEKQFLAVERVIDIQLKSALIGLAPFLLDLIKLTGDLANAAARVADMFRSIQDKRTATLKDLRGDFQDRLDSPMGFMTRDHDRTRVKEIDAELAKREREAGAPAIPLTPTPKATGGGRGGGRARTPRADRSDEQREARRRRVEEDIYRATLAELDIHNGVRRSIEERRDLSLDRLDMEEAHRKVELDQLETDYKISDGKKGISKAERERLETLEAAVRSGEALNIKEEAALDLADERLEFERLLSGFAEEELALAESMARTQKERRELGLQRLAAERAAARVALETSLNRNPNLSDDDRSKALNAFDLRTERMGQGVRDSTKQPLEAFFDGLPRTTDEVNEAFQRMEAEGLSSLIDGLAAASVGAADLGDVFRNVLLQMAMDANRILLQSLLSGAAGGMGGGGTGQKALGFLGSLFGMGGVGGGGAGSMDTGTLGGLNNVLGGGVGFAGGGLFQGQGGPTSDSNLAMISDREFIVNAAATRKHLGLLTAINDDRLPHFKDGGLVGEAIGKLGLDAGRGAPGRAGSVLRGHARPSAPVASPSLFLPDMIGQLTPDNDAGPSNGRSSRITTSRGTGRAVVQHIVNNYSHAVADRDARRTSAQSAGAAATKTALAARRGIA